MNTSNDVWVLVHDETGEFSVPADEEAARNLHRMVPGTHHVKKMKIFDPETHVSVPHSWINTLRQSKCVGVQEFITAIDIILDMEKPDLLHLDMRNLYEDFSMGYCMSTKITVRKETHFTPNGLEKALIILDVEKPDLLHLDMRNLYEDFSMGYCDITIEDAKVLRDTLDAAITHMEKSND